MSLDHTIGKSPTAREILQLDEEEEDQTNLTQGKRQSPLHSPQPLPHSHTPAHPHTGVKRSRTGVGLPIRVSERRSHGDGGNAIEVIHLISTDEEEEETQQQPTGMKGSATPTTLNTSVAASRPKKIRRITTPQPTATGASTSSASSASESAVTAVPSLSASLSSSPSSPLVDIDDVDFVGLGAELGLDLTTEAVSLLPTNSPILAPKSRLGLESMVGDGDMEPSTGKKSDKKAARRYFDGEDISVKCYKCARVGHISTECTNATVFKPCWLCGLRGHPAFRCTRELCFRCMKAGHQSRECTNPRVSVKCCFWCGSTQHAHTVSGQ